jgi:vitamin K-dependent gamma-carboxylase-like protein
MAAPMAPVRAWLASIGSPIDARVPAAFRICLGAVALSDLLDRMRDAFTFYSDRGLVTPPPFPAPLRWSALGWASAPWQVVVFFALALVVLAAFTAGHRTRLTAVLTWLAVHSVQMRNLAVCDGGDMLLRILCFWAMFADLGARWSLDVALGRRAPQRVVPGFAVRVIQLQLALVYLLAGLSKIGGSWTGGTAVFYAVQDAHFGRPLGAQLARLPLLCRFLGYYTVAAELAFLPLVFAPIRGARALALALVVGLHLGIFATLRVGIFSVLLPASLTIFLRPAWIDAVAPRAAPIRGPEDRSSPWSRVLYAAVALQFGLVLGSFVPGAGRSAWMSWLRTELGVVGLRQGWSMFAPSPSTTRYELASTGRLTDGTPVDVLAVAAPLLLPHPGFFYSRWFEYGARVRLLKPAEMQALGAYLCRRHDEQTRGPPLAHFVLTLRWREILAPGESLPPWRTQDVLRQPCR